MNRTKKIAISIMTILISILGICTTANVSNAIEIGEEIKVTYDQYHKSDNLFCIEKAQYPPSSEGTTYEVKTYINIEGRKSIDKAGKQVDHEDNAILAYILSQKNYDSNGNIAYPKGNGKVANGIWRFISTWYKHVGIQYSSIKDKGYIQATSDAMFPDLGDEMIAEAREDAKKVKKDKAEDKTNKEEIKVVIYEKNQKQYMRIGPFKWEFPGTMDKIVAYDQNKKVINNLLLSSFSGNKEYWYEASQLKTGTDFYVSIPMDSGITKITGLKGETKRQVKGVKIWFLEDIGNTWQNLIMKESYNSNETIPVEFDYDIPLVGELKIKKIDKDTKKALEGIGFKIYSQDKKQWITVDKNGNFTGYASFDKAYEACTNTKGITQTIKNLPIGKYDIYETKLGKYSNIYSLEDINVPGETQKKKAKLIKSGVQVSGVVTYKAENLQEYINLSGYVWVDRISGKQSLRNDLFKDNDYDSSDILLDGITVRLKDRTTGKTIAEAKTANGGAYLFKKVLIKKLADYYIEFEYDGLTYTNVVPHTDRANGSKAIEGNVRATFDNKFAEITKDTTIDGTKLEYNSGNHQSTLINSGKFTITSTTKETPFDISGQYKPGMIEIKNINLGLYEREQPDIALVKDIENIRVAVNGYEHMYQYASRFVNEGNVSEGFNVGVKFGEKYGTQTYSRAIYKSDYEYHNESDKSKELKVYITYKIAIRNESTNLTSRINSLLDYYDTKYTLVAVGTEVGKDGNVTGNAISHTEGTYNNDYKKSILATNITIEPQKETYIYVQFSMDKETVGSIMFDANGKEITDKLLLDNVVEVNSYTTYKDDKLYAGIDNDSRPGNAIPGDVNTYEDDTDAAPALQLVVANARKITGTVFLDGTSPELRTGEERLGDGEYKEGETTISGVQVKMLKEDGTVMANATTDENGNFELTGFIPGDYKIVYTWGDTTYTVKDYKGTIYKEPSRSDNNKWYQTTTPRYSDAIDNYDKRKAIDSGAEIATMDSTTPTMKFGIEMFDKNVGGTIDITPGIDKVEFIIPNVDFGIVERARQQLDVSKRATAVKITLANGQVILDAKIIKNADGVFKAEGTGTKVLHIVQAENSAENSNEKPLLWNQIDNELIQGATIQIEYTITVANNSELDYDSENYYKFGIPGGNKVTIKPSGVYDYLDSEMVLDSSKEAENTGWVTKTTTEYKTEVSEPIVDKYIKAYSSTTTDPEGFIKTITGYESFFEEYSEEIKEATELTLATIREKVLADKTILYNANLEKELQPGESNTVNLYTSKVLSNSEEIDLNNSAEITKVERKTQTGREVTPKTSRLYDQAETVIVTPPTGDNQDYIIPIVLGISTLIILGAGVILIKNKVLKK